MNQNKSFLDRGTLIALVIVMGFWIFWSRYMDTKYPQQNAGTPAEAVKSNDAAPKPNEIAKPGGVSNTAGNTTGPQTPTKEEIIEYSDENMGFQVTSRGMGLKKIDIKTYATRDNKPIILSKPEDKPSFATLSLKTNEPINFAIERVGQNEFIGRATDGDQQIEKRMKIDSENYHISVEVTLKGNVTGTATQIVDELQAYKGSSFLSSRYDHQDFFVFHDNSESREVIRSDKGLTLSADNISVIGLNDHYFAMAIADKSDIAPRFETNIPIGSDVAIGRLIHKPASRSETMVIKYDAFAGPKQLPLLRNIDDRLTRLIDYGMFKALAKPLLGLLRFFFSICGNWGVAIILLTLLVRAVVMPFNVYSFRSMKVMQRIQPEMKQLREKHKSDPTRMNQEVMALMKRHKANPLGGCLPMLIQLPVFFALYSSLSMSIELYRSPFALWIQDLSVRDPYFVIPVLMGVAMYFQQKLTPSTMDPQQQKIMQFMPIVFSAMMLSLPSGLTLYILVSTVFAIVQQYLFLRDRKPAVATA